MTWLAQVSSPNPVLDFTQLGIASIVCVLLFGTSWVLWRKWNSDRDAWTAERVALQREKDALYVQMLAMAQQINDRVVPTLTDALRILGAVPAQLESALTQAQKATAASEGERLIKQMQDVLREIEQSK
jgi:hypothetical protein